VTGISGGVIVVVGDVPLEPPTTAAEEDVVEVDSTDDGDDDAVDED
jgi:hypothetical protein